MYSQGYLMKLWRLAVLNQWGDRCAFCGTKIDIECHHIVRRRNKLLKFNWRNGIPLCKWKCHHIAHTKAGERMIEKYNPFYEMLVYWESKIGKQQLLSEGKSETDFHNDMYDDLMAGIKESPLQNP